MATFVATLRGADDKVQTFVFPGTTPLDAVFEQVAKLDRHMSMSDALKGDDYKVYTLMLSRDQASEPPPPSITDMIAKWDKPAPKFADEPTS